ncbi:MAG: putative porin [Bacteroidales bacterium]|jgi:hypothetical protein|nr:putative porin [Bacteroidales bacterium]
MLLANSSGFIFGQEKDSVSISQLPVMVPLEDTIRIIPEDSLSFSSDSIGNALHQSVNDTIVSLKDSVPKIVIIGLADPLDTLSNRIYAFNVLDKNSFARIQVDIDTTLSRFEINNPVMKKYYIGPSLGNTGLSYYPIGFEARKRPSDFLFTDHLSVYMHNPEETVYYHTQTPYTNVCYSSAGSKAENESILSIVHTQNVNKRWNVGLNYDILASVGQYPNQNSSDNAFSLFSAFRGSQYSMYANFNWNNIRMRENGGIANFEQHHNEPRLRPQNYTVRSLSGKTIFLNRSLYVQHAYSFKKLDLFNKGVPTDSINVSRFTLNHTFKYEWNKREFTDTDIYLGTTPNFGTKATHDSLYFRRIFNHFELMLKEQSRSKFTAGFSVGLLNEMDRYNNNIIPDSTIISREGGSSSGNVWGGETLPVTWSDTSVVYRGTKKYFNTALTGRFFNHTGRYLNWDFSGRLYFTGYKIGDFNIDGNVQLHYYTKKGKNTLLLGGNIENAKPSYFLNKYASNWLVWDNDFKSSQEIRLRGEFIIPHRKFKAGVYVSQLNNHVFINSDAVPEQYSDLIVTGTAFIEKDIKWWKFGFLFRLYGQYSSHENVIPLPAFAGYQSTYFEAWLVRDVLKVQLGWDINYHTKYYAYAYMPSSGMFYLQEEQKIGNYPFFDVFLNFQIKKARLFVKTEGLSAMLEPLGRDYFMVYRYPLNTLRVKFGVSWAFYD